MEVCYYIFTKFVSLLIFTSETLCMKGLVVTHMGKREEGLDLVKKGVRLDLTSHICWHVFGLIQKADKKYEEALKSYTQALKYDRVCTIPFPLLQNSLLLLTSGKYESFTGFCTASDATTVI
jgi:tetratricopeptide (TPR) repeat protein